MRKSRGVVHALLIPIAVAMIAVPAFMAHQSSLAQPPSEQRVEIVIRDYIFEVPKPAPVRPGWPTVIILRNQDIVKHGFTSQMLAGVLVYGEGEGVSAYGKGVEGFYIDPGKTLIIRFVNDRPGKYAFRCDLHPNMKGEMYVLDVPTA